MTEKMYTEDEKTIMQGRLYSRNNLELATDYVTGLQGTTDVGAAVRAKCSVTLSANTNTPVLITGSAVLIQNERKLDSHDHLLLINR